MNTSPTLPTPTENTDIGAVLEKHSLDVLRAAGVVYKRKLHEDNLIIIDNKAKAAITKKLRAERIDELTRFKLPEYDHTKCIDQRSCIGYQNAQSDFDNEKLIRLAALQAEETS